MDKKWHRISFKIKIPDSFYIDLIIIDLLIRPVIEAPDPVYDFWSFHKGQDVAGHILEFRVRVTDENAPKILEQISSNHSFEDIKAKYLAEEVGLEPIGNHPQDIGAIADESWPPEIKKAYPRYIKGACEMYLELVKEVKNQNPQNNQVDLGGYYQEIEKEINKKWYEHGWHAYFHNLTVLFSYSWVKANPHGVRQYFDFIP